MPLPFTINLAKKTLIASTVWSFLPLIIVAVLTYEDEMNTEDKLGDEGVA